MDSGTGSQLSKYTSIIGDVRLATSDASDTIEELAGLPAPPTSYTLHLYPFHLSLPFPFSSYTARDLEILPGLSLVIPKINKGHLTSERSEGH